MNKRMKNLDDFLNMDHCASDSSSCGELEFIEIGEVSSLITHSDVENIQGIVLTSTTPDSFGVIENLESHPDSSITPAAPATQEHMTPREGMGGSCRSADLDCEIVNSLPSERVGDTPELPLLIPDKGLDHTFGVPTFDTDMRELHPVRGRLDTAPPEAQQVIIIPHAGISHPRQEPHPMNQGKNQTRKTAAPSHQKRVHPYTASRRQRLRMPPS
ncbi:hypothetical protein QAD02_011504 [Eretmocerus hayati]|uniref:Uncharacterized protein n=1 Tax=Eretmocerus hayati TaxID=131215 RepID=A0ACC2NXY3_9HYME|nr:hypothetical protein QAD02_011504 [Eretmocerus hayati]